MGCGPSKDADVAAGNTVRSKSLLKKEEEEEEGKFIAAGSPDRYFSSRKDEEAVQGVTASMGYFSSPSGIVDGEEVEASDSVPLPVDGKEEEAEKKVSDGNGGEELVPKQEEGKASIKDFADLKETIVVEENERKL